MNMSDDVTGAALQISMHAAEKGIEIGEKVIDHAVDDIAKLLKALGTLIKNLKSTDLSDIKSGEVSIKKLVRSARRNGDTLSTSENALTKADIKAIKKMAKKYGIPVAFTGKKGKDNVYANVRTSDLPIFQRICTEMMKEKLAERPQELGNFKVNKWEVPFITSELNKYDLSAQFGTTKNGEYFCLYEKSDEKAIMIARNEFVKKCSELKENMTVTKDENFFIIKDKNSGKEISFETVPTREELSEQMQKNFGYDKNKADIACAKFGEENLKGEEKEKFFSDNPQNKFSRIDTNITIQGESIYTKDYTCWRVTPKSDDVPKIVFQNENGNFAVLNPEKMTRKQMENILRENLQINDKNTINALIEKAEKVSDYYKKLDEKNFSYDYEFKKSDFDMSNPETVSGMQRVDENGNTLTKKLPLSSVSNDIERNGKDEFTVTSTVKITETDQNGKEYLSSDKQKLQLSFSDKKNALHELSEMYKKQGIPENIANQMAKEVFAKAEAQSAEKVLQIEEIKAETQNGKTEFKAVVTSGNKSEEIIISDPEKAVSEISEKFEVSENTAVMLIEKAQENINGDSEEEGSIEQENLEGKKIIVSDEEDEILSENNDDSELEEYQYNENEIPPIPEHINEDDIPPEFSDFSDVNDDVPEAPEIPSGRGGR